MEKQERMQRALTELIRASQGLYGRDIVVQVGFDITLGNSRADLSDVSIDDIIGTEDEDNIGNK